MKTFSTGEMMIWISFLAKWGKPIVKASVFLFIVAYIYFFMRAGFTISGTTEHGPFVTVLYGIVFAIAYVIFFFVEHFAGGQVDFDLKWVVFFIGLAVGGAIIGLIAGSLRSFLGYITGGALGLVIIVLTLRIYLKQKAQ